MDRIVVFYSVRGDVLLMYLAPAFKQMALWQLLLNILKYIYMTYKYNNITILHLAVSWCSFGSRGPRSSTAEWLDRCVR
jgi:hypothetical protein